MSGEPIGEDGPSQKTEAKQRPGKFIELTPKLTSMSMPQVPLSQILSETDAPVVFIQDTHGTTPLGNILNYPDATILASQGFTHYLVEGSAYLQPLLDQLGQGKTVPLVGVIGLSPTGMKNEQDTHAIYSMSGRGLKVLAIDHPGNIKSDPALREQFMHDRIKEVIDGGGRAIATIGGMHAIPLLLDNAVPTVASRLIKDGIDVVSVAYKNQQRNSTSND